MATVGAADLPTDVKADICGLTASLHGSLDLGRHKGFLQGVLEPGKSKIGTALYGVHLDVLGRGRRGPGCPGENNFQKAGIKTAKVLEGNPMLMRPQELEVLERVATSGKLNVVLGEKGLAERVVNLL